MIEGITAATVRTDRCSIVKSVRKGKESESSNDVIEITDHFGSTNDIRTSHTEHTCHLTALVS
jgi:hypothetical protein